MDEIRETDLVAVDAIPIAHEIPRRVQSRKL
jgi:hypothetical protein